MSVFDREKGRINVPTPFDIMMKSSRLPFSYSKLIRDIQIWCYLDMYEERPVYSYILLTTICKVALR